MKRILLAVMVSCAFGVLTKADSFQILSSRAAQNPTDIIDWTQLGLAGTVLSTPALVTTFNGNPVLVGNINGSDFLRMDESCNPVIWCGNFDYGESLLWTGNSNFGIGGLGPFAMVFLNPVASFGFAIQADLIFDVNQVPVPFVAGVEVFDSSLNPLTFATFNGVGSMAEDGSALFVGMLDTTAVNIGAILIGTDSGSLYPTFANDFAIDDPSFTGPEPSSIILLGSSLVFIAWGARRKLRRPLSAN